MQLRFLLKSILIASLFLIISLLIIQYANRYLNKKDDKDALYIWGDSQTYQGLDLKLLKQKMNCNVYSAAKHGAGVYDFLVFAENVPEKSRVIVGLSKWAFIRGNEYDYNRSGLDIKSCYELFRCNYSFNDVKDVALNNFAFNSNLYITNNELYKNYNAVKINMKNLDSLNKSFEKKSITKNKILIFTKGIEILKSKGCEINFIKFPNSLEIDLRINKSKLGECINSFFNKIKNKNHITIIKLKFSNNVNYFYDLTHLNELGATYVTKRVADILKKKRKRDKISKAKVNFLI